MAIPDASLTIRDGGLGLADGNDNGIPAFIGPSSSGTANEVNQFSDPQSLKDEYGTGPMVEAALFTLAKAGGPVICVKTPSSSGGVVSAVVATKTGTAVLAAGGTALDAYSVIVEIMQAGASLAAGTATFRYSLDGGRTYSAEIAVPTSGTYVIPGTGITLTWTTGTFVVGDYWTFTSTSPAYTLSEGITALTALLADVTATAFLVHFVGAASSAANAATMFASVEAAMQAAASTNYRYMRALIETPQDTDANLKTAFLSSAGTRTMVAGGWAYVYSPLTGAAMLRSIGMVVTARAASVAPNEDLGKVLTGPVTGVHSLVRDEYKTPGLDAAGFVTLRTHVGKTGYYVTHGRMMVSPGSDFKYLQYGRVMDIAATAIRAAQLDFLNDEVLVSSTTGKILETEARNIEANIDAKVRAAVTQPGYASSLSVTIDRTTNVLSLQKLVMRYRIVPLAYLKTIEGEVAFENPALRAVAA